MVEYEDKVYYCLKSKLHPNPHGVLFLENSEGDYNAIKWEKRQESYFATNT